ncbi:MAG: KOW domain-containing RNA-binding protein [Lachnospiraceae bacterium]|nr:KOW domain-containing RNA-binding protein [Lachnospiraceae bacterium]
MNGRYAISKAGRDAGKIYIIVGSENGTLLLADGVERKLANPKKKNSKHVEIPEQMEPKELAGMIAARQRGCDEAIRQILHHMMKNFF